MATKQNNYIWLKLSHLRYLCVYTTTTSEFHFPHMTMVKLVKITSLSANVQFLVIFLLK